MHISARNKYIVKVSMVKYTQINAYLAKKSPDTQTKAKIPRSSEKSPAVATLFLCSCILCRVARFVDVCLKNYRFSRKGIVQNDANSRTF